MENDNWKLKWQKDFESFFGIYNTFILEGYVDDEQPYEDENKKINYCKLFDYFDKIYTNNPEKNLNKRVIIYDPTEAYEKRFKICDKGQKCKLRDDADEGVLVRYGSAYSNNAWNVFYHSDREFDELLIDHRASGISLDFAKIHMVFTSETSRLDNAERNLFFSLFKRLKGEQVLIDNDELVDLDDNELNIEPVSTEPSGYLVVVKMTSRLLSRDGSSSGLSDDELMIFRQLLNISQSINESDDNEAKKLPENKLVLLVNKLNDLPTWFTDEIANPYVKLITVSHPSDENKLAYFNSAITNGNFGDTFKNKYDEIKNASMNKKRNPIEKKFLAYTNDFSMTMLRKYCDYVKDHHIDDPSKIGFSISTFRVGDMTNPWDDPDRIKEMLKIKDIVRKKIKGQDEALDSVKAILTRAALGLDRAENPNAPRVVLFLAGPTGTGKTELCKQIAECIFGSEDRIVRFDMSEYGQAESDQKLFGAPPGYVGYEEGGKLTNAVKKEPFSLILFDEIEKAHNSILDKFLQILGDGRLTDGKGETVRFTDCIIVITSNAGVNKFRKRDGSIMSDDEMKALMNEEAPDGNEMNMSTIIEEEIAGMTNEQIYEDVKKHLRYNLKAYFYCGLGRPELYGRIEDSIVYYNYIGKDAVKAIAESKIKDVIKSAEETYNIKIEYGSDVIDSISKSCQDSKVRELGARGIIKHTGKLFTTSLSNELSKYISGENGYSREDLNQIKRMKCTCSVECVANPSEIKWETFND